MTQWHDYATPNGAKEVHDGSHHYEDYIIVDEFSARNEYVVDSLSMGIRMVPSWHSKWS